MRAGSPDGGAIRCCHGRLHGCGNWSTLTLPVACRRSKNSPRQEEACQKGDQRRPRGSGLCGRCSSEGYIHCLEKGGGEVVCRCALGPALPFPLLGGLRAWTALCAVRRSRGIPRGRGGACRGPPRRRSAPGSSLPAHPRHRWPWASTGRWLPSRPAGHAARGPCWYSWYWGASLRTYRGRCRGLDISVEARDSALASECLLGATAPGAASAIRSNQGTMALLRAWRGPLLTLPVGGLWYCFLCFMVWERQGAPSRPSFEGTRCCPP